jgi:hypothetical protein
MKSTGQKSRLGSSVALAFLAAVTIGAMRESAQPLGTVMHVEAIAIQKKDMLGRGPRPIVEAIVWIKDQSGNPVSEATVTGEFSGCFTKANASAKTDTNGQAFVLGGKFICTGPCTLTFTVTGVAKRGATYDPSANIVTQGSVSCP